MQRYNLFALTMFVVIFLVNLSLVSGCTRDSNPLKWSDIDMVANDRAPVDSDEFCDCYRVIATIEGRANAWNQDDAGNALTPSLQAGTIGSQISINTACADQPQTYLVSGDHEPTNAQRVDVEHGYTVMGLDAADIAPQGGWLYTHNYLLLGECWTEYDEMESPD